jgi:pentatricopeptide repeat protein
LLRHGVKHGGSYTEVMRIWNQMKSLRVPLDASAYNAMVAALSDLGELDLAFKYFNEYVRTKQPVPMEFYQTILVLYGKQGKVSEMEILYERVSRAEKVKMDVDRSLMLLNAVMTGYTYGGAWKKVWLLWNRLRLNASKQHTPIKLNGDVFTNAGLQIVTRRFGVNTITVSVMMDALGFSNQLDLIRKVWKDLEDSQFPFVLNNVTSLAEALIRCRQYDEAIDLVLNLQKYGMQPDLKILRNTITMLPEAYRLKALDLFKKKYKFEEAILKKHMNMPTFIYSKDKGVSMKKFKDQLEERNGLWLLPPINDLVEPKYDTIK